MSYKLSCFLTLAALGLTACAPADTSVSASSPEPVSAPQVSGSDVAMMPVTSEPAKAQRVHAYMKAFNDRNVDAMLTMATENVEWISLEGKNLLMGADGAENLRSTMLSYFEQCASCRSSLRWTKTTDERVVALEEASWDAEGERKSQEALSVYEFEDEKIRRVYYFPAE